MSTDLRKRIIKFLIRCNSQYPADILRKKLQSKLQFGFGGYQDYSDRELQRALELVVFDYYGGQEYNLMNRYRGREMVENLHLTHHKTLHYTDKELLLGDQDVALALGYLKKFAEYDPGRVAILSTSQEPAARVLAELYWKKNQDEQSLESAS